MTDIAFAILTLLHHQHTIHGVTTLARMLNVDPRSVRKQALLLATQRLIKLTPGTRGRGHATEFQDIGALNAIDHQEQS